MSAWPLIKEWRLQRLKCEVEEQRARCEWLLKAEKEYASSYYTDRHIEARVRLARLESRLAGMTRPASGASGTSAAAPSWAKEDGNV